MSKILILGVSAAEKLQISRWPKYCETPCTYIYKRFWHYVNLYPAGSSRESVNQNVRNIFEIIPDFVFWIEANIAVSQVSKLWGLWGPTNRYMDHNLLKTKIFLNQIKVTFVIIFCGQNFLSKSLFWPNFWLEFFFCQHSYT